MKDLKFTIENTGGVERAELSLRPGVNVLKGRNGAGKTSAINAVVRASGGSVPLQRKDGAEVGRVRGPGVSLKIKGVVKTTGHAELELADVGPLGRLIDPRLKDSKAAARERVRALVELLGVRIDDEKLLELCNGDRMLFHDLTRAIDEAAIDDLLEASEKLRNLAHKRARAQEDLAAAAGAEVDNSLKECRQILADLGGPAGLSELSLEVANGSLEAEIRNHDRALAKCEAREALEEKQNRIRETLGPEPDAAGAEAQVASKAAAYEIAKGKAAELAEALQAARFAQERAARELENAASKRDETLEAVETWQKQKTILEETPAGPTRADLEKIKAEGLEAARERLRVAGISQTFREREKAHDAAVMAKEKAEDSAEAFRELAADIPAKLGKILASAGAPGLTVSEGRLHVTTEDGPPRDFEYRCSTGERARAALAVAAQVYKGRVLALDGEVWGNLDPANRAEFAAAAQECDLCVVTEEPAEGALRLELRPGAETTIEGE